MATVWDTTLASRLHPHSEALEYVIDRVEHGTPVRIAAPAILEIAYGCQLKAETDSRYAGLLAWFARLLGGGAFAVVAFDGRAALVAGRLHGVLPHPPAPRRDHRSNTIRQASWRLDIEIAATAYAAGLDVATENRDDYTAISDALAELFPRGPRLAVVGGPV